MKKQKIDEIFSRLAAQNPHPVTELYSTNPFTLLVAIVLSAQATDAGVNKATPALFAAADTPEAMLMWQQFCRQSLLSSFWLM